MESAVAVAEQYSERQQSDVDETREEIDVERKHIVRHPTGHEDNGQRDDQTRQPLPTESGGRVSSGRGLIDGAHDERVRHADDECRNDVLDDQHDDAVDKYMMSLFNKIYHDYHPKLHVPDDNWTRKPLAYRESKTFIIYVWPIPYQGSINFT